MIYIKKSTALTQKTDYNIYSISFKEKMFYTIIGIVLLFCLGYIFYKNIALSLLLSLFGFFTPSYIYPKLVCNRKKKLNSQFKDLLYCVSSCLSSGKSVEYSFINSYKDLKLLYLKDNSDILKEVSYIIQGLQLNEPIEELLSDLAKRSHDDDITSFAEVFTSCKRSGGNLIEVIKSSSNIISDKIDIQQDIQNTLSEKKFEHKIMSGLIIILIPAITYMSGDYMDAMFTSINGHIIMSISLGLFILSYKLSQKILSIDL